jgi:putative endonuclease
MGMESYQQGLAGEEIAERYLVQHGYEIVERNFRSQQGEIDLVAREGDDLVFVEVKNYSARSYGTPLSAVNQSKRRSIIHAARTFIYRKRVVDTNCRFDVITIYRQPDGSRAIELYQNAFVIN